MHRRQVIPLTDLGPAGNPFSQASYVTNNGVVTGSTPPLTARSTPPVWQGGRIDDIGYPDWVGRTVARAAVNQFGQIVIRGETSSKDPNNENFCGYGDWPPYV